MLKRYGDNAHKESAARAARGRRGSRRRRDLAADHRCHRATCEHHTDRPAEL